MHINKLAFCTALLCLSGATQPAMATYYSSVTPPAPPATSSHTRVYYTGSHPSSHYRNEPFWVAMHAGQAIPLNAVVGGSQYDPNAILYICRASYRGGVHPGKYYAGNCNISWGGKEVMMQNFEVLVSRKPMHWVQSSAGNIPRRAFAGGQENGNLLFICQAEYENGTHPGKVVGNTCNFGWGGREILAPYYNVLIS